ncbi:MAG: hypothetical protein QW199_01295 [Candidatus Pacearchaeota archaeon]
MIYILSDTNHFSKKIQKVIALKLYQLITADLNEKIDFFTEVFKPDENADEILKDEQKLKDFLQKKCCGCYEEVLEVIRKYKENKNIEVIGILPQKGVSFGIDKPFYENFENKYNKKNTSIIHIGDSHRRYFVNELIKKRMKHKCYIFKEEVLPSSLLFDDWTITHVEGNKKIFIKELANEQECICYVF